MDYVSYFNGLFVSIEGYKKSVLLLFLIKNDVHTLHECGLLKTDIIRLYLEFKIILIEQYDECLFF